MTNELKDILLQVERPARYVGGEFNLPDMEKPCDERVLMCFSDKYEIGMSNIGIRILYHMLNDMDGVVCERCFAPDLDLAAKLREHNLPLFSLETKRSFKDFDIVGFSVQFELQYTNIAYMFDLAKIPYFAKDRGEEYPIMVAGGPCSVNPMPYADFFDVILIGDGEVNLKGLVELHRELKDQHLTKAEFLAIAKDRVDGIYVPSLKNKTKRAIVQDLDKAYFPTKILVPNCQIVHDRSTIELFRGCANGCRFCQACFYYRPIRERKVDTLVEYAKQLMDNTGYEEMSLASLSTSDYSGLKELVERIKKEADERKVKLAVPSLRLDSFEAEIYEELNGASLTFAPEAGSQRLRDVINKNISEANITSAIEGAMKNNVKNVKLYFMIGLPTETNEDLDGIAHIAKEVLWLHKKSGTSKMINITVSTSVFIPKPLTPFQWEKQITLKEMEEKQKYLQEALRIKNVRYNWHDAKTSYLEAVFARGDEKLAPAIVKAYEKGCVFDSWSEYFDFDKWMQVFEECGINPEDYTREYGEDEVLPWDVFDNGVTKQYLLKERHLAYQTKTTPNCIGKCNGCGASKLGRCFE